MPLQTANKVAQSAWSAWQYSDEGQFLAQFGEEFSDRQFKDLANVIGFDPRSITKQKLAEAQAIASFIWDDAPTRAMLTTFGKDFVDAQHGLEMTEFGTEMGAEIAVDVIITALTAGAGASIAAAGKLKHMGKLGSLGGKLSKLADALKARAMHKNASGATGGTVSAKLDKPEMFE